jgi:hypothetical protein
MVYAHLGIVGDFKLSNCTKTWMASYDMASPHDRKRTVMELEVSNLDLAKREKKYFENRAVEY